MVVGGRFPPVGPWMGQSVVKAVVCQTQTVVSSLFFYLLYLSAALILFSNVSRGFELLLLVTRRTQNTQVKLFHFLPLSHAPITCYLEYVAPDKYVAPNPNVAKIKDVKLSSQEMLFGTVRRRQIAYRRKNS